MNLNHTVKVVGSVLLSAVMAGSMMPVTVFAQNNDENPTEKTETVYSVLNSDGSISDTIVSSWLHDEDGINNIKETLNLTDVKNIKSNEKPSKDGNTYTWNAKGNDVYYEGTGTKQLPVSVKLRYELDGQEMSAKDMEGKSGHLKLTISFTNNYSEIKNINGKSIVIHPSYLAGGMLNMSTGNFTNVKCESGKIVNDGTNEMLAFANIPGLNETLRSAGLDKVNNQLGISDDVTVEADVNNFDLGSIMVGMTNEIDLASELNGIGSVSELTDGIDQLIEADDQLIDGSKQLYDGTTQLKEQAAPLTGSSDQVRQLSSGAIQLNKGLKQLKAQVNAITPDQLETMQNQVSTSMKTLEGMKTLLGSDVQTLTTLQTTLGDAVKKLDTLANSDTGELTQKIGTVMKDVATLQTQINNDKTIIDSHNKDVTDKVADINKQIDIINSQINTAVNTANGNIDTAYSNANSTIESAAQKAEAEGNTDLANQIRSCKLQAAQKIDAPSVENGMQLSHVTLGELKSFDEIKTNDFALHIQDLNDEISKIEKTLAGMNKQLNDAKILILGEKLDGTAGLSGDVQNAINTLGKMNSMLDTYTADGSTMNFKELVTGLQAAAKDLSAGSKGILGGVQQVNAGLTLLQKKSEAGITQVAEGSKTLSSNSATLNGGASALSQATGTLAGQSGTFNEMADGLDTLGKAFETLNDGAKQLYEGNEQFKSEGLDQLKEKVDLGVGELETLQSVMNEIKAMNKEYASYSGAPEGATVTSRYVFRTKEESSK